MRIDIYDSAGKKKGTMELPASLFEAPLNEGLMHRALVRQQSNRRRPVAHVKSRGEVQGSTRKLYRQKGTGRARRGSVRSPLLRGGGKAFGPRSVRNFGKAMPKKMRRAALRSCLSHSAKSGKVIGLDAYDGDHKTGTFTTLLGRLPVNIGRKIVFVLPEKMEALERGSRNVPGVKTLRAGYLNPEDVLGAHHLVFVADAVKVAEETFGRRVEGGGQRAGVTRTPHSGSRVQPTPPGKRPSK